MRCRRRLSSIMPIFTYTRRRLQLNISHLQLHIIKPYERACPAAHHACHELSYDLALAGMLFHVMAALTLRRCPAIAMRALLLRDWNIKYVVVVHPPGDWSRQLSAEAASRDVQKVVPPRRGNQHDAIRRAFSDVCDDQKV